MVIKKYEASYRDDLIFMILQAKDALGRVPALNADLLDIENSYFKKGYMFWIAVDEDDRVIGSIAYSSIPDSDEVFLHRLFVKSVKKRNGIGSKLLEYVEQYLKQEGKKAIHIHLGEPKEQWFESYEFYKKHGYLEYKNRYMKKEL